MSNHTPGPWSWWTSNSLMRLTAGHGHGQRDGGVLCAVRRSDGFADIEVKPEDARLIAAAPDLLASLIEMRDLFDLMCGLSFNPAEGREGSPKANADAAIAKALGEAA